MQRRPDRYTPITPELLTLMDEMCELEGNWHRVAAAGNMTMTMLKQIRRFERRTIPRHVLERMIDGTGIGDPDDFLWFSKQDLESLGIWRAPDARGNGANFWRHLVSVPYKDRPRLKSHQVRKRVQNHRGRK